MTEYLTEQEQIQQLKNWVKQYGVTIVLGIVIALTITYAWRYWQTYHNRILQKASVVFDDMLIQRAQNNNSDKSAEKLVKHYPKTPYADMAAMMTARNFVLKKEYDKAITQLQWAINHSQDSAIREIARTRMARVLIAQKKPDEALKILQTTDDPDFMSLIDEIRGDALLLKNDTVAASKAYTKALAEQPNAETSRPILEMKSENLTT